MKKERILKINKTFLEKAKAKMKDDFKKDINAMTDIVLIICLPGCYLNSKKGIKISKDEIFLAAEQPSDLENNYITIKVRIYTTLVDILKKTWKTSSDKKGVPSTNDIINTLLASYIRTPLKKYTDRIAPLYTIVGSKNQTMQGEVAEAVKQMQLEYTATAYIEGCCATGSLFFGLHTYPWKQVILNDLNSLRTNFLNVLLNKPLEFVKKFSTCAVGCPSSIQPIPHIRKIRAYALPASAYASAFCSFRGGLLIQRLACIAINCMQASHWIATAQVEKFLSLTWLILYHPKISSVHSKATPKTILKKGKIIARRIAT